MRKALPVILALIVISSCGSGSTITGRYRDTIITDKTSCTGGSVEVDLTDASGRVIARDRAAFQWTGGACIIPFGFPSVPGLPGYGVRINGISGTQWLTPAQASRPVNLTLSGF